MNVNEARIASDDTRPLLLMVEDDVSLQAQMKWSFDGYRLVFARDRESALIQFRRHEPPVVTVDLGLPPQKAQPEQGFQLMRDLLQLAPNTKIIAVTGQNDRVNAVKCIGMGAHDFISKPVEPELLGIVLSRAFKVAELEKEGRCLVETAPYESIEGLLTRDVGMERLCRKVERLAPMSATILLAGESGTGKELLARALHKMAPRNSKRFVALNCAAIPETLLEAELFGFERGSFTGAHKLTIGKIESAHGGTLFLDEIGDLPLALQAKLLRFLQERVVERIGSREEVRVDVRVVAATHRNLKEMIAEGRFREDLYYRLAEVELSIPALRERPGDATVLARAFVARMSAEMGGERLRFTDDAINAIESYSWPGNVRELENHVKRAALLADRSTICAEDLGIFPVGEPESLNLRQLRDELDRRALQKALSRVDGNIARAAELLGVTRPTLYDLMNRLGMR